MTTHDSSSIRYPRPGSSPVADLPSSAEPPRPAAPRLPVNWRVVVAAGTMIVALSSWAMAAPEHADAVIGGVVAWVASRLG